MTKKGYYAVTFVLVCIPQKITFFMYNANSSKKVWFITEIQRRDTKFQDFPGTLPTYLRSLLGSEYS